VVVSLEVKKTMFGKYSVYGCSGEKKSKIGLADFCLMIEEEEAAEIFFNSIDGDGTMYSHDLALFGQVPDF
jgi:imidazole glycerol-phosphate synthase subunit HisF